MTICIINCLGQDSTDELIGVYESTSNKFERYSVLVLEKDNRFIYKYGVGACQGEVKGKWTIEDKRLKFTNDNEFLDNETIVYPNLGLSTWTVKKIGVKPEKAVDSGCAKDGELHLKRS